MLPVMPSANTPGRPASPPESARGFLTGGALAMGAFAVGIAAFAISRTLRAQRKEIWNDLARAVEEDLARRAASALRLSSCLTPEEEANR